LSYSFINNGALTTLPSGLVEGHLNTEWEEIFNLTDWGFHLIKEDKLYYLDLFLVETLFLKFIKFIRTFHQTILMIY